MSDVRYAIRQLQRTPGFACAVVATLALAIGANTALFSLVNAIVLRTLPVREPERIVVLQGRDERGEQNRPIYYSTFSALQKLPVFESLSLYSGGGLFQLEVRGARVEGLIEASTPGLFESLGVRPYLDGSSHRPMRPATDWRSRLSSSASTSGDARSDRIAPRSARPSSSMGRRRS